MSTPRLEFFVEEEEEKEQWDSPFEDDFWPPDRDEEAGITVTSYWFNTFQLKQVSALHQYLHSLTETGKVLSLSTTMNLLSQLDA